MESRAKELREWRHRTGRSKRRCPKGQPDYRRLAWIHARRNFRVLLTPQWRSDLAQEIELLAHDAERRSRWGKGGRKNRIGQTRFVKMLNAAFHRAAVSWGLRKLRGCGYGRSDVGFESLDFAGDEGRIAEQIAARAVLRQIAEVVGEDVLLRAALGDRAAVTTIRQRIGLE